MRPTPRLQWVAPLTLIVAVSCADTSAPSEQLEPGKFTTLTGQDARLFALPADSVLIQSRALPHVGLQLERYQQRIEEASVFGGEISILRNGAGQVEAVLGTQYGDFDPANAVTLTETDVIAIVSTEIPKASEHYADLMFDPASDRYFYSVDSHGEAMRHTHWIDAGDGAILRDFNTLTTGCNGYAGIPNGAAGGVGFDGSEFDLSGLTNAGENLLNNGAVQTRDMGSWKKPFWGTAHDDSDGCWDDSVVDRRRSPDQGAAVSAHAYISQANSFFIDTFAFHLREEIDPPTQADPDVMPLDVRVHYEKNYANAFWNGAQMVFGDGDGVAFREMTAADIAYHELSHGVTEHTSNLVYQDEPGALNEAFSDVMALAIGHALGTDTDWLMGEDSDVTGQGFRNAQDPTSYTNGITGPYPADYCDLYTGTSDNGGVHINSSIVNHAFYLMNTQGGVPMADLASIFYTGFATLPANANFLAARAATVTAAGLGGTDYTAAVAAAWDAVHVINGYDCNAQPPGNECTADSDCDTECNAGTCSNGNCSTAPVADGASCGAGGLCCSGSCSTPTCSSDADCSNSNECTAESCSNAGTCGAECSSNDVADETSCAYNETTTGVCCSGGCADADSCDVGGFCGDGICEGGGIEDGLSCGADCRCTGKNCSKTNCGDGVCEGSESTGNCPVDCPSN